MNKETRQDVQAEITLRAMTKSSRDADMFAACFAANGSPKRPEAVRWQYFDNPAGCLYVDFAVASERGLAAIYATLPARMRIGKDVALGLQSVDTMTDEAFRGRGLFLKLAKGTFSRAADDGVKLVYGFPNGNSAHGFFERLEWQRLDPVPFLIRPMRSSYPIRQLKLHALSRLIPDVPLYLGQERPVEGRRVEAIQQFDERATALWQDFAKSSLVGVERDARYLNWRLAKPGEAYQNLASFAGDRMCAMLSYTVKDKHEGRIGYIMEALCGKGCEAELRQLFARAMADMSRQRADVVLAWCLPHSATYGSHLRMGFLPFPTKLRPIELHFGARSFDNSLAGIVCDRGKWYLSYLDSDTV